MKYRDHSAKTLSSSEPKTIALAGNPNVGKSTIFNALTGMKQHTGNWPGKTVENARGSCIFQKQQYTIVDLPGTYSLNAHSAEEEIARDYICSGSADIIIVVCDATCLERSLRLALQILDLTSRVIICVNLMDEARKRHLQIDSELLSKHVGVPVVATSAHDRKSLTALMETVCRMINTSDYSKQENKASDISTLTARAESICHNVLSCNISAEHESREQKFDRILTSRFTGYPIMFLLLAVMLWLTIAGANYPSRILSALFFRIQSYLSGLLLFWHAPGWLHDILISGIWQTVFWVVSVMLPPMAIFFPLFTLLEDAGYLPRIAYNLDRPFQCCHACGKQSLTMCMGLGCNAVGVTGCRIIDSPRERLLAILTNSFVPCNGRFPLLIAMLSMFFTGTDNRFTSSLFSALLLTLVLLLGIGLTFLVTALLSATLLRGIPSAFTLELPPYRKPQIGTVLIRSIFDRTLFVLGRAAAVAAPTGLLIWLMANLAPGGISLLDRTASILDPFARLMGLDGVILMAFILGLPANEIVLPIILMAYLAQGSLLEAENLTELKTVLLAHGWTWATAVSMILFSLCHWPCSTTLLTIKKETGSWKWTAVAALLPTLTGMILCILFTAIIS